MKKIKKIMFTGLIVSTMLIPNISNASNMDLNKLNLSNNYTKNIQNEIPSRYSLESRLSKPIDNIKVEKEEIIPNDQGRGTSLDKSRENRFKDLEDDGSAGDALTTFVEYILDEDGNRLDLEGNRVDSDGNIIDEIKQENILVAKGDVYMRKGPSIEYDIMNVVKKDIEVYKLDEVDGWFKIRYQDEEGFMSGKYAIHKEELIAEELRLELELELRLEKEKDLELELEGLEQIEKGSGRDRVVEEALQLVNKVPYFWGGKSQTTGWNSEWNTPKKVSSSGSSSTGKVIPFGLDCSGFVDWAYRTAGVGDVFSHGGTSSQWNNSYAINRDEMLPGDVAFKQAPNKKGVNHIGIYVGKNDKGEDLFIHSASSKGGVVVTTAAEAGLYHFRRANDTF